MIDPYYWRTPSGHRPALTAGDSILFGQTAATAGSG